VEGGQPATSTFLTTTRVSAKREKLMNLSAEVFIHRAAAIAVHRELGPGLLKTVYEVVQLDELRKRGVPCGSYGREQSDYRAEVS
jgi:hypothetical protein